MPLDERKKDRGRKKALLLLHCIRVGDSEFKVRAVRKNKSPHNGLRYGKTEREREKGGMERQTLVKQIHNRGLL